MVFSIIHRKAEKNQRLLDAREAFNLWEILRQKYIASERVQIWLNDAHDKDLIMILKMVNTLLINNIHILEDKLVRYSVPSPDRDRTAVNFPSNSQAVYDQFIAQDLLVYMQESIECFLRAFRTSVTNDTVRTLIKSFVLQKIDETDKLIKYLKLKGWIATPPLYKNIPVNIEEKITTVEVANLWDHLTFRYDNLNTSEVIRNFAFDGDFKLTLNLGIKTLKNQSERLEKILQYFGIPLPQRPGNVSVTPRDTEILRDDHMFRTVLIGMQGAAIIHSQPIKECTFNDRVRGIFRELLVEELDLLDKYYKFAKSKGWLNQIPMFGANC